MTKYDGDCIKETCLSCIYQGECKIEEDKLYKETTKNSTLGKRQFFGYWRWVHIRKCATCGLEVKLLGNDTRMRPSLPPGAIICSCGKQILL